MANYATASNIEDIFGIVNVERWADLDNNQVVATITARKTWALTHATNYVNGRLVMAGYSVPFSPVPSLIVEMTAMYAGILLYDGRRVVKAEDDDQVAMQRKMFHEYLRQILKGQLKLVHPTTNVIIEKEGRNQPFVVN